MTGYRKLIALVALVIVVCIAEGFGGLSAGAQETLRWLYGAFAAGNGLEHVVNRR